MPDLLEALTSNGVARYSIADRPFGEPTEYVLNQVIDTVLAKDKEFLAWRGEHRSRSYLAVRRGSGSAHAHRTRRAQQRT